MQNKLTVYRKVIMSKFIVLSLAVHFIWFIDLSFLKEEKKLDSQVEITLEESPKTNTQEGKKTNPNSQSYKNEEYAFVKKTEFTQGEEIKPKSVGDGKDNNSKNYVGLGVELDSSEKVFVSINASERIGGYKVVAVSSDYGGFLAGLKKGDVLLKVNNQKMDAQFPLKDNQKVLVLVWRNNSLLQLTVRAMKIPYT
jgi:C-terminal processing protease CtpA/Prc